MLLKERGADGLSYALYANGDPARPSAYVRVSNADRDATGHGDPADEHVGHVAMTFDGFTLRLYVNGTQVATRAVAGSHLTSNNPLRMGGSAVYGEFFAGLDRRRAHLRSGPDPSRDRSRPRHPGRLALQVVLGDLQVPDVGAVGAAVGGDVAGLPTQLRFLERDAVADAATVDADDRDGDRHAARVSRGARRPRL